MFLLTSNLLQLPTTKSWLALKDAKERDTAPFHQTMAQEVSEYYFRNYAVHFSSDAMSTAFATIPQVMTCIYHSCMTSSINVYVLSCFCEMVRDISVFGHDWTFQMRSQSALH